MPNIKKMKKRRVKIVKPIRKEPEYSSEPEEFSTAHSLLKYAGTWVGNDIQERLREVYQMRGKVTFPDVPS
jgi:hypothetical protein